MSSASKITMTPYEDLFKSENTSINEDSGKIQQIQLNQLIPFCNHPFKPYSEDRLNLLAEDILKNGVINPIIVRPKNGQYEILAGHNRTNASRKAKLTLIPAIVRDVDDDDAALIMVTTNLNQRETLLPSEKAFAYKIQLEAMKSQGKRSDLTCGQLVHKSKAREQLAEDSADSGRQIQRYIRLTCLTESFLEMIDSEELGFNVGVSLSYLTTEQQELVMDCSGDCERRISGLQASQIKQAAESGDLDEDKIRAILLPDKPWNAHNEFLKRSSDVIPKTANDNDFNELLEVIKTFFKGRS